MRTVVLKGTMKMRTLITDPQLKEDRVAAVKVLVITQARKTPMEDLEVADLSNNPEEIWATVVNPREDTEMIMKRTTMRDLLPADSNLLQEILPDSNMINSMTTPLDTLEVEEAAVAAWAEWEIEVVPPEEDIEATEADTMIEIE